jgi:hypothetical protein
LLPYISSHHHKRIKESSLTNSSIILEADEYCSEMLSRRTTSKSLVAHKAALLPFSYSKSVLKQRETFELILNQPLGKFWITPVKTLSCEWFVTTLIQHYMLTTCICNDHADQCKIWTLDEFRTSCEERIWSILILLEVRKRFSEY